MNKGIFAALLLLATGAFAYTQEEVAGLAVTAGSQSFVQPMGRFNPGDTCSYDLSLSLGKGTMTMTVKSATDTQLVMDQDINILGQAQSCESVSDLTTGKITSLVCNGKAQTVPDTAIKIISTKQEQCTVPAGNFACMHITAQDEKNETIEQWVNGNLIPVSGMIKTITPSQFGSVTVELTSFKRAAL